MELLAPCDFLTWVRGVPASALSSKSRSVSEVTETLTGGLLLEGTPAPSEGSSSGTLDEARLRSALVQLAQGLHALHAAGRVHLDVKPSNVLVDDDRVVVVDFGLVRTIDDASDAPDALSDRAGTLAYMAPEQITGDGFDPAADWYAVGVMLYMALTGRRPFSGNAARVLFQKATTGPARAPSEWVGGVPEDLEALCLQLLKPAPEERPTGAEVIERLGVDEEDQTRPPTEAPFVGRDSELAHLYDAFDDGGRAVVLRGDPGVGKTALVDRFLTEVRRSGPVTLFRGRCYQTESVPFKAFDSIVDQLTGQMARVPSIATSLAGEANLAANLFPVLRRVRWLEGRGQARPDNIERLRRAAFMGLKRIFTHLAELRRVVVFVDDLQWADPQSLSMLEVLLAPPDAPNWLFLATLRTAEVTSELPTSLADKVEMLDVTGLSATQAQTLLEHLGVPDTSGRSVSELVRDSRGHPLFLQQLARMASGGRRGPLRLQDAIWQRRTALADTTRRVVDIVAVAGAPVPLQALQQAARLSAPQCARAVRELADAELIRSNARGGIRYVAPFHDRVREAVVQHLDAQAPDELVQLQLGLGQHLEPFIADEPSLLFRVTNHFNAARSVLTDKAGKARRCRLNLRAGRVAFGATSYGLARGYLQTAESLCASEHWHTARGERLELERELIACAFHQGDVAQARRRRDALLARLDDAVEQALVWSLWAWLESGLRHCEESIEAGRKGLELLGVSLPQSSTPAHVMAEHTRIVWRQGRRTIAELAELPLLDDRGVLAQFELLATISGPAFFTDSLLLAVIMMRMASTTLVEGLAPASAFGFAGYGLVLSGALGAHDRAREFGELAVALNARFDGHAFDAKVGLLTGTFITGWVKPLPQARATLRGAIRDGLKHNDPEYVAYAIVSTALFVAIEGGPLPAAIQRFSELLKVADTIGDLDATIAIEAIARESLRALDGMEAAVALPHGAMSDAAFEALLSDEETPAAVFWHDVFRAWTQILAGDMAGAERYLVRALPRRARTFAFPTAVDFTLLRVAVEAWRGRTGGLAARGRAIARCRLWLRRLRGWDRWQPHNFGVHRLIAEGVCARLEGRDARGRRLLAEAAGLARERGALRSVALAHILREDAGAARTALQAWGAEALAASLRDDPQ